MKTIRITILSLMVLLCCSGCDTFFNSVDKGNEAISQGTYAVGDSMTVGRFDLAKKYNDQTERLVPPPKKRIPIQGIYR